MLMQLMLKDSDYEAIREAFKRHLQASPNMPTPYDILTQIKALESEEVSRKNAGSSISPEQWARLQELRERDRNN